MIMLQSLQYARYWGYNNKVENPIAVGLDLENPNAIAFTLR